ncbi:MAG: PD-(D/E)XK nuclease family protein, partial [Clostridia bacterium]|nr:PD-(D/E)XK nuclease family protein [Clostridia bacterium]
TVFANYNVYVDSFTSFTAEEYAVLRAMLRKAYNVVVTLGMDEHLLEQPSHSSIEDTRRRLTMLAMRDNVTVQYHGLTDNLRARSPELRLLERNLWNLSLTQDTLEIPDEQDRGAITVLRCANVYAEAEATALHILDLIHQGYRYGDIAITVRDAASYRGILDAALERYGIPFYFSEKTALSDKPLSRLLLSALRAVAYGFQSQDILTMLKTGLCPVSAYEADLFEQYVATWNINGSAFAAPAWTRNPDGYTDHISKRGKEILAAANRVREAIMTPLLRFHGATAGERTLPALCEALYDLMQAFSLSEQCARLAHDELSAGYLKQAGETVRVFDTVLETLTQMGAYLPDATMDVEEFTTALSMVFSQTEIASVPSLHDSVTVGSADTLRVENIAVSFVLGLNEGEFPKAVSDEGLLSDAEKNQLYELGIEFDSRSELRSSNELLFVWRAMTKPSDKLFVSTILCATDGKEKTASVAYNRLFFLFPYLKEQVLDFDLSMIAPEPRSTPAPEAEDSAKEDEHADEATAAEEELYQPFEPSEHDLSPALLSRLFEGDVLWLTQSKIQDFVLCPYSFYCTHFLSPREREVARIDYADSGTFIHYLLEQFLRRCLDGEGVFHLPPEEEIEPLANRLVDAYLRALPGVSASDLRTLHVFRKLKSLALLLLRDILYELSHSRFTPRAFELNIGGEAPGSPAAYEIPLEDGKKIRLGGKIDRVDFYRRGDDIYLRVIDYKSSAHDISLQELRRGLNLQLIIYLFALCRPENIQPAGALYVATSENGGKPTADRAGLIVNDEELLTAMNDEMNSAYLAGIKRTKKGELTGKALTDPDELAALEEDIRETLRRIGQDMLCGRATRKPSADACRYCSIKDGCPDAVRPTTR